MNRRSFFLAALTGVAARFLSPTLPKPKAVTPKVSTDDAGYFYAPYTPVTRSTRVFVGEQVAEMLMLQFESNRGMTEQELHEQTKHYVVYPLNDDALPFDEWRRVRDVKKAWFSDPGFVDAFTKPIRTRYVDYDKVAVEIMEMRNLSKRTGSPVITAMQRRSR